MKEPRSKYLLILGYEPIGKTLQILYGVTNKNERKKNM